MDTGTVVTIVGITVFLFCGVILWAQGMRPPNTRSKARGEDPVELCTNETYVHDFGVWGKVSPSSDAYDKADYRYRMCKICGLSERRKVRTQR